jgi:hypothetical protein
MKRSILLSTVLASLTLLTACPTDGGNGSPSGDLVCDDGSQTQRACPGLATTGRATALQTLAKWKESLAPRFPKALWLGGMEGLYIGRDGKVLDQDFTLSEYMGIKIPSSTSWQCNFCNNDGPVPQASIHMTTVATGTCGALMSCGVFDCSKVGTYVPPAVDSDQAIAAAFPGDPDPTYYQVQLVLENGRFWSVSRLGVLNQVAATVKIDCDTGAVLP